MAFLAEWLRDRYNDSATAGLGKYDANRYGVYLRWSPGGSASQTKGQEEKPPTPEKKAE
jgi:hypothetical protein